MQLQHCNTYWIDNRTITDIEFEMLYVVCILHISDIHVYFISISHKLINLWMFYAICTFNMLYILLHSIVKDFKDSNYIYYI